MNVCGAICQPLKEHDEVDTASGGRMASICRNIVPPTNKSPYKAAHPMTRKAVCVCFGLIRKVPAAVTGIIITTLATRVATKTSTPFGFHRKLVIGMLY